jgi:hypothetical protein
VLLCSGFVWSCSGASSRSSGGCAIARIGGRTVCLHAGQACKPGHERVYRSYGLTCKLEAGGYRLSERYIIGPANP